MFGWTSAHIPLLVCLPLLVVISGFFSGSETALFGLSHHERMTLRRRGGVAARSVETLLSGPRVLLITVLLGNMVVNVLYFVISSVLLMAASESGVAQQVLIGAITLMVIVLGGEVIPKLLANSRRMAFARFVAPSMLGIHRLVTPVRSVLDSWVVAPLSRLTAPSARPTELDREELVSLLSLSHDRGEIDDAERGIIEEVIDLGQRRVSDVMTPRVKMAAIRLGDSRDQVIDLVRETGLTKLPLTESDLDHVVGMLHAKAFVLGGASLVAIGSPGVEPARFIPEVATLDRLLEDFRTSHIQTAIAVDEYGGTAGIVAVEDVVREIVGDLRARGAARGAVTQLDGFRWRVDADTDIRDVEQVMFGRKRSADPASIGGLIASQLGRGPEPGDVVGLGEMVCEVKKVSGTRIVSAVVTYSHSSTGLGRDTDVSEPSDDDSEKAS